MSRAFEHTGYPASLQLFERAVRVTPGGIYGHTSPALTLPGHFPYYARRAAGARYWDADGREFIDYLCAYGPIVLGYGHPEVEAAAEKQRRDGDCFNHPTEAMVLLAEKLVSLVDFAGWAVFGKNGSDMTTWAVQVAREFTGRPKILTVRQGYHGAHAWCTPGHGGLIPEDRAHIHSFGWNDPGEFRDLVKRHRGRVAAVISSPFHHPSFGDSILPAPGFWADVQETCRREGILFILDDVRAGFRLHLGGSHRYFGCEPDLICFSKALGNGYSISAALGREELKVAASRVFLTGSFWQSAVAMRAALATLEVLERDNGIEHMRRIGETLMTGLGTAARRHGLSVTCSGPPAIPFMSFANETDWRRSQRFCAEMALRGVFFHPHHNWFVSTAHTDAELDQTLAAADAAFAVVKDEFGN
jgi:glutamate-1-semialdehyde 2,1-aminomutase